MMNRTDLGGGPLLDRIEADAVCEQCGTVNPEGTLFCKSCGNNLRDQRLRRVNADGVVEVAEGPHPGRRVLAGLLTVFGLLLVLWTALNVGSIEETLTEGMAGGGVVMDDDPSFYWTSGVAGEFDDMVAYLDANPITTEDVADADAAQGASGDTPDYEGRYFLREGNLSTDPIIGYACVRQDGNMIYFVAKVDQVEVRGEADVTHTSRPLAEYAAVKHGSRYTNALGFAQKGEGNTYTCYGQMIGSNASYEVTAHKVP